MSKRQVKNIAQILLKSGASPEQIKVIDAEAALAGAMEVHGTVVSEPSEYCDMDITDFSDPSDARNFVAMKLNVDGRVCGWVSTTLSDIAESIQAESGETVTCYTKSGRNYLIERMRNLARAVEALPEDGMYA